MCQSMVEIQPAAAEIRRGKKRKKKIEDRRKETTGQKYNGPPITQGGYNNEETKTNIKRRCSEENGPVVKSLVSVLQLYRLELSNFH